MCEALLPTLLCCVPSQAFGEPLLLTGAGRTILQGSRPAQVAHVKVSRSRLAARCASCGRRGCVQAGLGTQLSTHSKLHR